jgi:cytochrome c2
MRNLALIVAVLGAAVQPVVAQDLAAGEASFRKCTACHGVGESATNRMGPILNNLFGRTAGTQEGYSYSRAMVAAGEAGLVWTPQTMTSFLHGPRAFIPGNKMSFVGIKSDEEVANVVAYLMTFSPDYKAPPAPGDKIAQ